LERFVYPEVESRLSEKEYEGRADLISCVVREAKDGQDADPQSIKGIVGSTAAGATYSSAALIVGVVVDLVANPHFLEEIREEIRTKHEEVEGVWGVEASNGFEKLGNRLKWKSLKWQCSVKFQGHNWVEAKDMIWIRYMLG